jgi:hypothetical protein
VAEHPPCGIYGRFDEEQHLIGGVHLREQGLDVGLKVAIDATARRQDADTGKPDIRHIVAKLWRVQESGKIPSPL